MITFYFLLLLTIGSLCDEVEQGIQIGNVHFFGTDISFFGQTVKEYLGVEYAFPGADSYRFLHTKVATAEAYTQHHINPYAAGKCPQIQKPKGFPSYDEMKLNATIHEGCLKFNMWVPQGQTNAPVLIFFQGEQFTLGSASQDRYNGSVLAAMTKAIVIVPNYRLGFLGFAYLKSGTIPGNMGLVDQQLLLKYVNNTITHFGGDNKKVTLFGLGSGSASVAAHLNSEESKKYFKNAISDQGPLTSNINLVSPEIADKNTRVVCKLLGCNGEEDSKESDKKLLECLQSKSLNDIFNAVKNGSDENKLPSLFAFVPVNNDTEFFKKNIEQKTQSETSDKKVEENFKLLMAQGLTENKMIGCLLYPEAASTDLKNQCNVTKSSFKALYKNGGRLLKLNKTEIQKLGDIYKSSGNTDTERSRRLLLDFTRDCDLSKMGLDYSSFSFESVSFLGTIKYKEAQEPIPDSTKVFRDHVNDIFGFPFRCPDKYPDEALEQEKNYSKNVMWAIGNFTTTGSLPKPLIIEAKKESSTSSSDAKIEPKSNTCEQVEALLKEHESWQKKKTD